MFSLLGLRGPCLLIFFKGFTGPTSQGFGFWGYRGLGCRGLGVIGVKGVLGFRGYRV